MRREWMIASWLLTATVAAQHPDPLELLRKSRLSPPVAKGVVVTIRDAATQQPVPGAFVACEPQASSRELRDVFAALRVAYPQALHTNLAFAARSGRTWRADEHGRIRLPTGPLNYYALHGDTLATFSGPLDAARTIDLVPRRFVTVHVLEHVGTPAGGETVCISNDRKRAASAVTDRHGRARIEIPPSAQKPCIRMGGRIWSKYLSPPDRVLPEHLAGKPLVVKLPPLARVRIVGRTFGKLKQTILGTSVDSFTGIQGTDHLYRIPLELTFEVQVRFAHHFGRSETLRIPAQDSTERITTIGVGEGRFMALATLQVRRDGKLLRNHPMQLHTDRGRYGLIGVTTDAEGRLWIDLRLLPQPETVLYALRRRGSLGNYHGAGATQLDLSGLTRQFHDLRAIDLEPEPVMLSGIVVDDRGKPVRNACVFRDHGGSLPFRGERAYTDMDGRFALRKLELEPAKKVGVMVRAKGHVTMTAPELFGYGAKHVRIVVERKR